MRFPHYAIAEHFCLLLARRLKVALTESEVISVQGRPVLAVERYDRSPTHGHIERIHQEDACQALAVDLASGGSKHQSDGGPSLRSFAHLLARYARQEDVARLLATTTLNVAVGNADAHAKNLSILHHANATVSLAPAYDITPTTFYKKVPTSRGPVDMSHQLGMWINNKRSIHQVSMDDIASEGASWGLGAKAAANIVAETLETIAAQAPGVAQSAEVPEEILAFVASRTEALLAGKTAQAKG